MSARDRILRATLQVIGEDGIAGVSNRRVARAAGVSLGSLTYHFASQTDLLRESLLLFTSEEAARLDAIADRVDPDAVDEVVRSATGHREQVAQLELYLQASRDPDLREAVARCYAAYDAVVAGALAALGVADPARLAPVMVALVDGLALRRLAGDENVPSLAEALAQLARLPLDRLPIA